MPASVKKIDAPRPDRELLLQADIKTLLMVLVMYTHDEALLNACRPYINGPWDYMQSIPPELRDRIISEIAKVMDGFDTEEAQTAPPISSDLLLKMMSTTAGQQVGPEYVPMMLEHFRFISDAKLGRAADGDLVVPAGFKVAIVGAGMSGICAAIKLKEAGIPYVIFEKNDTVGGTWYENSYPGAGVDTPNHVYSYTFEPNHDWSEYFSKRDELFAYFTNVAKKYGIFDDVQFRRTVKASRYDERSAQWHLTVVEPNDEERTVVVTAVMFCVGLLNRPAVPQIQGLETFSGPVLHTARWDPSVSLVDKRVAMIGTGASGMQVGPTIAPSVARLTIFQRSPHWVTANPNYHRKVSEGKKWALKNIPYYADWYQFQLFWASADSVHSSLKVDPQWPHPDRSLNEVNERMRQKLVEAIKEQVGDDTELLAKVIPPYPPYGKRMLRDNNWYGTLRRDNVDLVTDPIREIVDTGVVTDAGKRHDADILILATGFSVGQVLGPIDVRGKGGTSLRDVWGEDNPRAFLGMTVPKFPNMFIMYGPNTNLAHGGSAMFHTECQVRYSVQALRTLISLGHQSLDVKGVVHDQYNERVDEAHSGMVWAHGGVGSWYKNKAGRVFATTPWRLVDYWTWTRNFNASDYIWEGDLGDRAAVDEARRGVDH